MKTIILLAMALLIVASGCGRKRPMYARPAQLAGQVNVDPYRVYVRGPRIYVETNVSNHGMQPIVVSRDAWALRLPSGEVLDRSTGVTSTHTPYTIQPGETRRVFVDFMKEGINLVEAADGVVLVVAESPSAPTLLHRSLTKSP